ILPRDIVDGGIKTDDISLGFFINTVIKAVSAALPDATAELCKIIGLLIVAAILRAFGNSVFSGAIAEGTEFLSSLCVCAASFELVSGTFDTLEKFVNDANALIAVLLPTLTALSAASGNVTFATSGAAVLNSAIAVLENVCASVAFPLLKACLCISLSSALCGSVDLSFVAAAIKKLLAYILLFLGTVMSCVLLFQRVITKSADTALLRGLKFSAGTFVPFVGSAIGDAMATVSGSVGVLRSTLGITGAVIICVMAILPSAGLIVRKLFIEISGGVASALGLSKESKFLCEMGGFIGFAVSITAFIGIFLVVSVSVLASAEVSV
ncbi:MAG: hypothetical protein KBS59_04365, partial [Clostridiales bacterium]|nr:hypothetical protein [Clostridiales bacterium]